MQRFQTYVEQLGSPGLVVARLIQCAKNHLAFHLSQRRSHGEGDCVLSAKSLPLIEGIGREVMPFDLLSRANYHRALHNVAQLAYVSGPRMKSQSFQRRRAEKSRRAIVLSGQPRNEMLGKQR